MPRGEPPRHGDDGMMARRPEIIGFTGIYDPYKTPEPPAHEIENSAT